MNLNGVIYQYKYENLICYFTAEIEIFILTINNFENFADNFLNYINRTKNYEIFEYFFSLIYDQLVTSDIKLK